MSSEFFDSFNGALPEFERDFGETWVVRGATYPAIAIQDLTFTRLSGAAGGPLSQASVSLDVRKAVATQSQVADGDILTVRGKRVRVGTISTDGDDSVMLICVPLTSPMPQH